MPLTPETPKSTAPERGYEPKEQLRRLREDTFPNRILDWFKSLFTKPETREDGKTLWGSFIGFLSALGREKEPDAPKGSEPQKPIETHHLAETQTQLDQLAQNMGMGPLDHTQLKSEEYEMNKDKTITLCSGTALKNLYKLGCRHVFSASSAVEDLKKDQNKKFDGLPSGDAYMVRNFYTMSKFHTKITGGLNAKENDKLVAPLDASGMRVADVLVDSRSDYNHRASAFKSSVDGHWYVLDPYRQNKNPDPIRLEQYSGNIEFVVPMKQDAGPALAYSSALSQTAKS
jgi:hypothetical protein